MKEVAHGGGPTIWLKKNFPRRLGSSWRPTRSFGVWSNNGARETRRLWHWKILSSAITAVYRLSAFRTLSIRTPRLYSSRSTISYTKPSPLRLRWPVCGDVKRNCSWIARSWISTLDMPSIISQSIRIFRSTSSAQRFTTIPSEQHSKLIFWKQQYTAWILTRSIPVQKFLTT